MNRVNLIGRVGKDPEIRVTQNGVRIANVLLATSQSWKDRSSGQLKERTEWHRVVVFGELADVVDKRGRKGTTLSVGGRLQTRKWTDRAGGERYTTEVVVDAFGGKVTVLDGAARNRGGSDESTHRRLPVEPNRVPRAGEDIEF